MAAPINSLSWWNGYFERQWEAHDGRNQTRYFISLLVDHLGSRESNWLAAPGRSILDWGCAMGDGVDLLCTRFPEALVTGLDFSHTAIGKAAERYPRHNFQLSEDGGLRTSYDAIITSNCLEHFPNPFEVAAGHLRYCKSLYIVMVPFREEHLHESHCVRFELDTFPEAIDGFRKVASICLRCDSPYWPGEQVIVTYGSASYRGEIGLTNEPKGAVPW